MEMSDNSFSIGDFVSENTARLSVTGNRILAVLLVAVVVLVTLFWLLRRNVERYSKFLAPRLKFGQKVYFLDRSMDNLIKDYVAPTPQTVAGELSFDNLMSIWFTRTIRNIMVVVCLVGATTLAAIFGTGKMLSMDSLDSVDSLTGLVKSAVSESTSADSTTSTVGKAVSFNKITIMYCTEGTLWAPVAVAFFINVFAHGVMCFQNSRIGHVKEKWLNSTPCVLSLRTILIYRLKQSKRVPDEKNSSTAECFYDEHALRKLVPTLESNDICITDGVVLSFRRGFFLRCLFWLAVHVFRVRDQRGHPRPVEVISDVRRHKEAMHALERVVVRYGRLKDSVGTLKLTVEEAIMKDFVQELTKVGEILEKHKKNELKEVKRIAKLKKKNRYIPPQGNHVYLTFSSSRQACVAFKELLEKKEMQVGTEERYVPEKHVIFAPPPAEDLLWHRVGDRAAIARVKDVGFYLVFVLTVIVAAFLTMAIGSLYNVESLAKMLPLDFLRNFVKQHPAILGNFSTIMPPILISLTNVLLVPLLIEFLAKRKSSISVSQRNRSLIKLLYAFQVLNQFVIFVLISPIYQIILIWMTALLKDRRWQFLDLIGDTWDVILGVPAVIGASSNYWISWFIIQCMVSLVGFCLGIEEWVARFWNVYVKQDGTIRYEQQSKKFPFDAQLAHIVITQPFDNHALTSPINVNTSFSQSFLLQVTVTLIMLPIAPLCGIISAILMCIISSSHQYQHMYVGRDRWEGRGEIWVALCDCFQVGICLMHIVLGLVIASRSGSVWKLSAVCAGFPVIILSRFKFRNQYRAIKWTGPSPASETQSEIIESLEVGGVFRHPSLTIEKSPFERCKVRSGELQHMSFFRGQLELSKEKKKEKLRKYFEDYVYGKDGELLEVIVEKVAGVKQEEEVKEKSR